MSVRKSVRWYLLAVTILTGFNLSQGLAAQVTVTDIEDLEASLMSTEAHAETDLQALSADLKRARQRLKQLNQRADQVDAYQREASEFDTRSKALQAEIKALNISSPKILPGSENETRLAIASAEVESAVRQSRQALIDIREHESWLNRRADAIAAETAQVAAQINRLRAESRTVTSSWNQTAADESRLATRRVNALVDAVELQQGSQTLDLLQQELGTLAPRQTLASLQGRALQLRLDRQLLTQDQHWEQLHQVRMADVDAQLTDATLLNDSVSAPSKTAQAEHIQWLNEKRALIESELDVLRRAAQVVNSIMDIYQVRYVLAQITDTGSLNDSLVEIIQTLRQQLPDAAALSNEIEELEARQSSLQVKRIVWENSLRGTRSTAGSAQAMPDDSLKLLVGLIDVANRVSDRTTILQTALVEAQTRTEEVATNLDGNVLWLRTTASLQLDWIFNGYSALLWISQPESWSGFGTALRDGVRNKPISLLILILGFLITVALRRQLVVMLDNTKEGVGNVTDDRYWSTPAAIGASLALALPVPLLLLTIAWTIQGAYVGIDSIVPVLADALFATSAVLCVLLFFKALCRADGVFRHHFEWDTAAVDRLHRHLQWFIWVCALCTILFTLAMASGRTDLRSRIMLPISVAYGSDIEHVRQLLMECTENTDDVLKNPESTVFLVNLGARSLRGRKSRARVIPF